MKMFFLGGRGRGEEGRRSEFGWGWWGRGEVGVGMGVLGWGSGKSEFWVGFGGRAGQAGRAGREDGENRMGLRDCWGPCRAMGAVRGWRCLDLALGTEMGLWLTLWGWTRKMRAPRGVGRMDP
jgi:hypothetical protein